VIYGAIICVIAALRPHGIVGAIVDGLRAGAARSSFGAASATGGAA